MLTQIYAYKPSCNVEPVTRASLARLGMSGRAWSMDTGPGNIQPMMLGAYKFRKNKYCDRQKPTFSSRLNNES